MLIVVPEPRVSVILPTHDRAAFIRRAIDSLFAQTLHDWELVVVDDASSDRTCDVVEPYLADPRVRLVTLTAPDDGSALNRGLGTALNAGLAAAQAPYRAYLPSDDVYYARHLESLLAALEAAPNAVLAYAGVRHHYNRESLEPIGGDGLQLVQLLHRRTPERWLERHQLVTDDLGRMGLDALRRHGLFIPTRTVSCGWVDHPDQRHKLLREPVGGIARYRRRYRISRPLRFHTTTGDPIDEGARYERYAERPEPAQAADGLRILLVGELAYNADRIIALEEHGHRLFGLWMPDPYWYNTVGPLPFGHVVDAPSDDPREAIRQIRPDVIYALLNWQAVPFAARVLRENPGVPFVWHFKEGPFISLEKGHWTDLVELVERSDGVIHSSEEMRQWFGTIVPGADDPERTLVLDGDLPKADWLGGRQPRQLSDADGEVHTVVPGRPIGLHPEDVAALGALGVHLHFYGDFTHGQWRDWIARTAHLAPRHLHLHGTVGPERWVEEFGRYDAGWLHVFRSRNGGEIRRADWDDLNVPARMSTLAVAGLPMLQRRNAGAIVASRRIADEAGIGIHFETFEEVAAMLKDRRAAAAVRRSVAEARDAFTFDAHVVRLTEFFQRTAARHRSRRRRAARAVRNPALVHIVQGRVTGPAPGRHARRT